jgi:hypothetical protein
MKQSQSEFMNADMQKEKRALSRDYCYIHIGKRALFRDYQWIHVTVNQ